ncbi:MAG TPA: hypothetical protein VIM07_03705 [Chitinophagaceae bacterium]
MAIPEANSTLRRLRNRYRLVVMNEDTYEEIVAFKLSRISVYIALSTLFIVLVGLTVALIAFTPLKLYIPGFGDAKQAKEFQRLKVKADSIERTLLYKQQYIDNIQTILKGEVIKQDTTKLKLKEVEKSND